MWFNCLRESLRYAPATRGFCAALVKNDAGLIFGLLCDGRQELTGLDLVSYVEP